MKKISLLFLSIGLSYSLFSQVLSANAPISIEAQLLSDRRIKLSWITPVAYKTSSFIIQKSINVGASFDDIGQVVARFDDKKRVLYVLYDEDILAKDRTLEYRLVEFKEDGTSRTSEVASVNLAEASPIATIGNGTSGSSSSRVSIEKQGILDVIKIKGSSEFKLAQVMLTKEQSELGFVCDLQTNGDDEMVLKPMYQLESGEYTIKIKDNNGTKKYKFTIKDTSVALN